MSERAAINPEYVAELERTNAALARENAELATANVTLTTANAALQWTNTGLERANTGLAEANVRLERMLAQARHEKFGPRSEKGDQLSLTPRLQPYRDGLRKAQSSPEKG